MKFIAVIMTICILASGGVGFAMRAPAGIVCNVIDPHAVLSVQFKKHFCMELSQRLKIPSVTHEKNDKIKDKDLVILDVKIISNTSAQYSVLSGKILDADLDAKPDLGPLMIEAMDAPIERTLTDHIYNDLKRFFSQK